MDIKDISINKQVESRSEQKYNVLKKNTQNILSQTLF